MPSAFRTRRSSGVHASFETRAWHSGPRSRCSLSAVLDESTCFVLAPLAMLRSSLCVALLACLASGCTNCDTHGQKPIEYRGGTPDVDGDELVYDTSGPFSEYLHFPAGRRFDLMHELGITPNSFEAYLSFERIPGKGSGEDNTGNFGLAAGNQVVFECADEERVRVRNDTCADGYLRVLLRARDGLSPSDRPCSKDESETE